MAAGEFYARDLAHRERTRCSWSLMETNSESGHWRRRGEIVTDPSAETSPGAAGKSACATLASEVFHQDELVKLPAGPSGCGQAEGSVGFAGKLGCLGNRIQIQRAVHMREHLAAALVGRIGRRLVAKLWVKPQRIEREQE